MKWMLYLAVLVQTLLQAAHGESVDMLHLHDGTIAHMQHTFAHYYATVIEKHGLSKRSGLSGIFWQMHETKATYICRHKKTQAHATWLWGTIEQDPAFKNLEKKLRNNSHIPFNRAAHIASQAVAQARKDIFLNLIQKHCYIDLPQQDLNSLLSMHHCPGDLLKLFKANDTFPEQNEEQCRLVRASVITQWYVMQRIAGHFLPRDHQKILNKLVGCQKKGSRSGK